MSTKQQPTPCWRTMSLAIKKLAKPLKGYLSFFVYTLCFSYVSIYHVLLMYLLLNQAMTIRIIVLMARQFRLLPASSILSLSSRIQSPFRLRTDVWCALVVCNSCLFFSSEGRIISCFLRKEEETTNILGFHGEILGPKQEPAPVSSLISMYGHRGAFFFSLCDILISTAAWEEHNFQVKIFKRNIHNNTC